MFQALYEALTQLTEAIEESRSTWVETGGMTFLLEDIAPLLEARRKLILEGTEISEDFRDFIWAKCREDLNFFVEHTQLAFDPRLKSEYGYHSSEMPILLMPQQIKYLEFLRDTEFEVNLIKKMRDIGASSLFSCFLSWRNCFVKDDLQLVSSLKLQSVHILGNKGTLMERINYCLESLPPRLKPNFDLNYCRITNHDSGSVIEGQSSASAGRSNRYSVALLDECAHVPQLESSLSALKSASPRVFLLSSPLRAFDLFHNLWGNPGVGKFEFLPEHDLRKLEQGSIKSHLEKTRILLPKHIFAREILGDFYSSSDRAFIESQVIEKVIGEGLAIGPRVAGLDLASSAKGSDNSVLTIRQGSQILKIKIWEQAETIDVCQEAIEIAEALGCDYLFYDSTGIGAGISKVFKQHCSIKFKGVSGSNKSPNRQLGKNMRDYLFNQLQMRIQNAYLKLTSDLEVSHSECLFLPRLEALLKQLRSIELDSGLKPRYTGQGSPDLVDSLRLTFVPKSVFEEENCKEDQYFEYRV
ncbi:hypothetical protein [Egbenema bharatensis]|uniref:hypothetical protein n=1 Tax=Egbenema bharatensis TaxID=3463334 RepID=UPI003A87F719